MTLRIRMNIKWIICASSVLLLLSFPADVSALTVGPVKLTLTAERGETLEKKIILFNETENPVSLKAEIANITFAPGEKGVPIPAGIFGSESLANWINISKNTVSLRSKERREIPFTVKIPKNASSGGYYAKIGWSPVVQKAGSKIKVIEQIASIILLRVEGDVKESASVEFFGSEKNPTRFEKMPIPLTMRIHNTGTVHIAPTGEIRILDYKGAIITRLSLNQGNQVSYILPNEVRAFNLEWKDGFRFGKYTASLDLMYGELLQELHAEYTFWIIPTYLLLAWLVVAALLIILCFRLLKKCISLSGSRV